MVKYLFLISFIVALLFQSLRWEHIDPIDLQIWSTGAGHVLMDSPQTYPLLDAYMHPGGPVIEGAILTHVLSKASFSHALSIFLCVFDSILIAAIVTLCYFYKKDFLWAFTVLALLCVQPWYTGSLYDGLTPPSIIASLVLPILSLITLFMYEKPKEVRILYEFLWCLTAGLLVATRVDIGSLMVITFGILLGTKLSCKRIFVLALGAFFFFVLFDPFMWFSPITQMQQLIGAMVGHYGQGVHSALGFHPSFPGDDWLAVVSFLLGVLTLILPKRILSPISRGFLISEVAATVVLFLVLSTSQQQADRYIIPLVFLWEVFLPLFIFNLVSHIHFTFVQTERSQIYARTIFKMCIVFIMLSTPSVILGSEIIRSIH